MGKTWGLVGGETGPINQFNIFEMRTALFLYPFLKRAALFIIAPNFITDTSEGRGEEKGKRRKIKRGDSNSNIIPGVVKKKFQKKKSKRRFEKWPFVCLIKRII